MTVMTSSQGQSGRHDAVWEQKCAELEAFRREHGHCNVPKGKAAGRHVSLGNWVTKRRVEYRRGGMPPEKVRRLEEIGIEWDPHSAAWEEKYLDLRRYFDENGHCNVPRSSSNLQLGRWVATQRFEYRKGTLSADRVRRLEALGMQWGYLNLSWDDRYAQLLEYRAKHGHCNVPKGADELELGSWLSDQRWKHRQGQLPEDKVRRLEKIGIQWNRLSCVWEERFEELRAFQKEHGHCDVPRSKSEALRVLRNWVATQKREHKRATLLPERLSRLQALGMRFEPAAADCRATSSSPSSSSSHDSEDSACSSHTRDQAPQTQELGPRHKKRRTSEDSCTMGEEGGGRTLYKPQPRRPLEVVIGSGLYQPCLSQAPTADPGLLGVRWNLGDVVLRARLAQLEASKYLSTGVLLQHCRGVEPNAPC